MGVISDLHDAADELLDEFTNSIKKTSVGRQLFDWMDDRLDSLGCFLKHKFRRLLEKPVIRSVICHLLLMCEYIFKILALLFVCIGACALVVFICFLALVLLIVLLQKFWPTSIIVVAVGCVIGFGWAAVHSDANKLSERIKSSLDDKDK